MKKILETSRLILREIDPALDAPAMYELSLDPIIMHNTGDVPYKSVIATQAFFEKYEDYKKFGFGRWAVVLKDNGAVAGWCGLKQNPEFIDLGFRLIERYRGFGYATEAAKASLEYGFQELQMTEIIARAKIENIPSISVMKKIGMTFWKEGECDKSDAVFYKMTAD